MNTAVEVKGLRDLRRSLAAMDKKAPRELNKALKKAGTDLVLVVADSDTPADSGSLRDQNRVTTKGNAVIFKNTKPYANTIHWGRKTLKRGGVKYPNVVTPTPYFAAAVVTQSRQIEAFVYREIEAFVAREVR